MFNFFCPCCLLTIFFNFIIPNLIIFFTFCSSIVLIIHSIYEFPISNHLFLSNAPLTLLFVAHTFIIYASNYFISIPFSLYSSYSFIYSFLYNFHSQIHIEHYSHFIYYSVIPKIYIIIIFYASLIFYNTFLYYIIFYTYPIIYFIFLINHLISILNNYYIIKCHKGKYGLLR